MTQPPPGHWPQQPPQPGYQGPGRPWQPGGYPPPSPQQQPYPQQPFPQQSHPQQSHPQQQPYLQQRPFGAAGPRPGPFASPDRPRSRSGLIVGLVIGLVVLLGGGTAVVIAATGNSTIADHQGGGVAPEVPDAGAPAADPDRSSADASRAASRTSAARSSAAARSSSAAAESRSSASSAAQSRAESKAAAARAAASKAAASKAAASKAAASKAAASKAAASKAAASKAAQSRAAASRAAQSKAAAAAAAGNSSANGEPVYQLADHPLLQDPNAGLPNTACTLPAWRSTQAGIEQFFSVARDCLDNSWRPLLEAYHLPFRSPELRFPTAGSYSTECGTMKVDRTTAASYCEGVLYIPLAGLQTDLYGDAPSIYLSLFAHEYGHHVQELAGLMDAGWTKVRAAGESTAAGQQMRRRMELQAQCFSGMFVGSVVERGGNISRDMYDQAWNDQETRGDGTSGTTDHGSNAHYAAWWRAGAKDNRIVDCNTFAAPSSAVS